MYGWDGCVSVSVPGVQGRLDWFSRHDNGFKTEAATMILVKQLIGASFECVDAKSGSKQGVLKLLDGGDVTSTLNKIGRGGRWGSMNDPTLGAGCPVYSCIFVDSGYRHFNSDLFAVRKRGGTN